LIKKVLGYKITGRNIPSWICRRDKFLTQRNMPSSHFDAKVFHPGGDINFIRPADLPVGYPNALGVVHGEPPLSLALLKA